MYELKFTREFKNALREYVQFEEEIAQIFRVLHIKPYSNRLYTSKSVDKKYTSAYESSLKKNVKILWRYTSDNAIYLIAISKL